jgi:hypothetical protein
MPIEAERYQDQVRKLRAMAASCDAELKQKLLDLAAQYDALVKRATEQPLVAPPLPAK